MAVTGSTRFKPGAMPNPFTSIGAAFQNAASGVGNFFTKGVPYGQPLSRPAAAAPLPARSGFVGPTRDIYEQPGVGYFDRSSGRFLGGPPGRNPNLGGSTPIVSGLDQRGQVDRTQSDLYKQYALNPQGQFDRYFGGSTEMDPYFGAASRGAGAPKNLAAMEALAGQEKAPVGTPLATYYRAQSAAGRGNMDELVEAMGYKGSLAEWAKANPMLAQREFNKRFPAGAPTIGPTPLALQADESLKGVTKFFPGAEPEGFAPGVANPVPPTQKEGEYGMTQGEKVDFFRGADNLRAFQAAKTSGSGMPKLPTTGQKVDAFLLNLF